MASALLLPALGACSGGGGGGTGSTAPPLAGTIVAALEVELPEDAEFLLRGSVPLPRGVWTDPDAVEPLVVLNPDGSAVTTQSEVVSWYPAAADGVSVAYVMARVKRPASVEPGTRASFAVTYAQHAATPLPAPGTAPVDVLKNPPFPLPSKLSDLLKSANALRIEATDVFGHPYSARPLDGTGAQTLLHHGGVEVEVRVAQTLRPQVITTGAEATLPHHLGVHAYLSASRDSSFVHLDLRLHNAHSGLDGDDALDDPLGKLYFRAINLHLPEGWVVVQDYLDPYLALPISGPSSVAFPLVRPNDDGSMHVIPWQGQFHRRLAIAPLATWKAARRELRGSGLGFARRDTGPSGKPLWSWWNADTARWFPQAQRLPSLEHVGDQAIVKKLAEEAQMLAQHMEEGTSGGGYPVQEPTLGWAHPYGVPYGGMAGGSEIYIFEGLKTLEAASLEGYRVARLTHRMHSDRMPNALFDGDGEPTDVDDWVVPVDGVKDYVPFFHYVLPSLSDVDPFGVYAAPKHQVQAVSDAGLAPAYESTILGFAPHDYQHLIRYTRSAKVLAWLDDDALAQDDLRMQAANFHLSYHRYFNSAYSHVQSTGLRFDRDYVDEFGPSGFTIGRGEGWALDCIAAAYATASPEWRAAQRPWLDRIVDLVADGQGQCNGFLQANVNEKFLDAKYRARQQIEQSILENALLGLLESVYRNDDVARAAMLEDVLKDSLRAMISPMAWSPGQNAPWAYTAVGPLDEYAPVWCKASDMPADGTSDWTDAYQNWSSFAYGYRLTKDPDFLSFALLQVGGLDLLGELLDDGLDNLENKAALLALAQELYGNG